MRWRGVARTVAKLRPLPARPFTLNVTIWSATVVSASLQQHVGLVQPAWEMLSAWDMLYGMEHCAIQQQELISTDPVIAT